MKRFLALLSLIIMIPSLAWAGAESYTVGGACGTSASPPTPAGASAPDWDTIMQCNGSTWQRVSTFLASGVAIGTTALTSGTVLDMGSNTSSMLFPVGTTGQEPTCNTSMQGAARYNSTTTYMEYCNGSAWSPFEMVPGTFMPDGTVFAGITPDGNKPMFVTPCDAGMTWSGSACTGTRATYTWDSSSSGAVTPGTLALSELYGKANTTTLVGLSNADSPYNAAVYCHTLSFGGHTDFYLPSVMEMFLVMNLSIPGLPSGAAGSNYWTSTNGCCNNYADAVLLNPSGSGSYAGITTNYNGANATYFVRCARHN